MTAPHARTVRPGDAPATGPLGAALVARADWQGQPGVHLVYADLDLAERAATRRALGLGADADDAEIVRAALQAWGDAAGARLGGTFAVAAWDGARQAVVGAVDGLGLRPLVIAETEAGWAVGGDVRALLAGGVPDALDEDMMAAVLLDAATRPAAHGRTLLRAVRALPPGHRLIANDAGIRTEPVDQPAVAERPFRGMDEIGEALRALLREVVAEAVADAAPGTVGVHLSAGIDSSAVAAFAAEALAAAGHPPPTAFSWLPAPDGPPAPDQARVLAVAERWGMPVVWCPHTADDEVAGLALDATRDPSTMWTPEATVRRAAAARGVRLMLSGWGGDEGVSFSGRGLVGPHLLRTGRWGPLAALALADPRAALQRLRGSRRRRARLQARRPLEALRQAALRGEHAALATPALLQRAALPQWTPPPLGAPGDYQAWLHTLGHLGQRTAAWAQAGAPHGLRYRYPLLDRRALAFARSLPAQAWITRRRRRRWPLRLATAGLVPDAVRLHDLKAEPSWSDATGRAASQAADRIVALGAPDAVGDRAGLIDGAALHMALMEWRSEINSVNPVRWTQVGLHALYYCPSTPSRRHSSRHHDDARPADHPDS